MDYDVWNCMEFIYHDPSIKIDDQVITKSRDKPDITDKKDFLY